MYNENVAPWFIVAKDWKHPKCSLVGNWLNKLVSLKMEHSTTVRMRYSSVFPYME